MSKAAAAAPWKTGMVRRAWDAMGDWLMKKEMVGLDKHGNKYYRYFETYRGETNERREVKWNTVYVMYNPTDVPSEWRMWLKKLRSDPPSNAEMERSEAASQSMAAKVAAIDEQERLARLRMASMGTHAQQAPSRPDLSRFLHQAGGGDEQSKGGAGGGAAPGGGAAGRGASLVSGGGEAKGTGETFTPGTWRPGQ
ncbi:hypothetical protein FOA52_007719 [Chlamydomonas sp. UWO 241]|nr:hypothetical protein FOA52_007719 [Chlamydomonas sp. UWO 241]